MQPINKPNLLNGRYVTHLGKISALQTQPQKIMTVMSMSVSLLLTWSGSPLLCLTYGAGLQPLTSCWGPPSIRDLVWLSPESIWHSSRSRKLLRAETTSVFVQKCHWRHTTSVCDIVLLNEIYKRFLLIQLWGFKPEPNSRKDTTPYDSLKTRFIRGDGRCLVWNILDLNKDRWLLSESELVK